MPMQTRRRVIATLAAVGATSMLKGPRAMASDGPLERTAVRFMRIPSICYAPEYAVEDLLRAEGFTDIRFVDVASTAEVTEAIASGTGDFNLHFAPQWVSAIDRGAPLLVLSGVTRWLFRTVRQREYPEHT